MSIRPIEILIRAKDEFSGMLGSMQTKVAAVAVAIAGFFGISLFSGAVKSAAEFESAMSRVKAAAGGTDEEFKALKQAAEDAGAATKYTSVEAAAALENLAKAGLNATQAIEALPAVLALAQAGDIELGTSAEYVTKAVMGMGLAFSDAGRVADVLALGANATNTSVKGLAEALSYAAPTAQSLGLSLETTVAIIGKFADAGIDASRAGTALNSIMSQFSDPASKFRNELAAIGITTGDFNQALHELAASGARGGKAINAVGLEAGPALKALLNQGMPALDELKAKLDNAAGSAAATAEAMSSNLSGSMDGLASAWDTIKTVLGTPVLPVLKDGVDQLAGALRGLVADGTIAKFGESFAEAFRAGIKWARDFFDQIDFKAVVASMQEFAAQAGDTFRSIGEHASMAGSVVKVAYGTIQTAGNTLLTGLYGTATGLTLVIQGVLKGLELLYLASSKVTFGGMSEQYSRIAADLKIQSDAMGAAVDALAVRVRGSLGGVGDGLSNVTNGFKGLATSAAGAKSPIDAVAAAQAAANKELEAGAAAAVAAGVATQKKASADQAAKQAADDNRAAVAQLREEYAALVASGSLQGAAEKLKEINQALQGTVPAAQDAAKAAAEAAAQIDAAFARLGVTSSAALKEQAANAQRDYEIIRQAGTSTAEDIGAAFKTAADKAIAANNGIAPAWVAGQAAARGYRVEVDAAGKATLKSMEEAKGAVHSVTAAHRGAVGAVGRHTSAVRDLGASYSDAGAKALAAQGQFLAAAAAQKSADTSASSITKRPPSESQYAWTRATIIDYLKQSGMDEKLSEDLAKQFVQADGSVPYTAGGAQKRWGGQHSTLSEALGKMADYYKYDQSGKHEAEQRTEFLNGSQKKPTPTPAPAPTSSGASSGAGAGGNTYISNITLPSGRKETMRFADAQSQSTGEQLLRDLVAAKGVSQ